MYLNECEFDIFKKKTTIFIKKIFMNSMIYCSLYFNSAKLFIKLVYYL